MAQHRRHGLAGTTPVGLSPHDHGLYDMIGNIWEWTSDYYSPRGAGADCPANPCCTSPAPRVQTPHASYDVGRPGAHIPRRVIKGGSHLCAPS